MAELRVRASGAAARPAWLSERLRAAPLATAAGAVLLIAGVYAATALLSGGPDAAGRWAEPVGPGLPFNAVLALLVGFTVWTGLRERDLAARDLAALRPTLAMGDEEFETACHDALARNGSAAAAALGAASGIAIHVASAALVTGGDPFGSWRTLHDNWNLALMALLFALMGRLLKASLSLSGLFSALGHRVGRLDLLAPEALAPFGRLGLRLATYWIVGSALALLLLADTTVPAIVAAVIVATAAVGVATLLRPCRGAHERIHEAKRGELVRVRAAIERASQALLAAEPGRASAPGPAAGETLAALVAYEARLEAVREWPFDAPLLRRFGLLLLVPLGSWIGGAMVERVLDAALAR
jgi:hypothetical protein